MPTCVYTGLNPFNFYVHGSVHHGNVYVQLKVKLDVYVFICILYSSLFLALHVSGAICTHSQEHKLQSTAIGMCNLWKAEVIHSIKRWEVIYFA
jgi:hypothetical protein